MEDEFLEDSDDFFTYAERPNKSQIKRDIAEIFRLAEEICALKEGQLEQLELPEDIFQQVKMAAAMPPKGAKKRQLKYITAQLRKIDLTAIQQRLDGLKNQSAQSVREHHQAEDWREKILSEQGHEQVTRFLEKFPEADSQYIRQLQRNAVREQNTGKTPKSARLLYRYLKTFLSQ